MSSQTIKKMTLKISGATGKPVTMKNNEVFGPSHLAVFMQDNDIPGEILELDVPTPTVEAAAAAVVAVADCRLAEAATPRQRAVSRVT